MRIVRTKVKLDTTRAKKQHQPFDTKSKYNDQELQAMQRSPVKQKYRGNLFCILSEQLFWGSLMQHHN